MTSEHLKQSELVLLLAFIFLLIAIKINKEYVENPPIITLSEDDENYRFESASDEVSDRYDEKLRKEIIPYLDSLSIVYKCNAIQIIGHTSGRGLNQKKFAKSNLDDHLSESLYSETELLPSSNVDLGMMRATAIMKILRSSTKEGLLENIKYWFPYSAGQLVKTDGKLIEFEAILRDKNWDHNQRRRVEIRLFRYVKQ
jgi:hypothetical protein